MNISSHHNQTAAATLRLHIIAGYCAVACAAILLFAFNQISVASQAGKEFNEADAALKTAYESLLSSVSDSQQRAQLIKAQKAWIKYRDDNVAFFSAYYPYSKDGLFFNTHLTRERTAFLKAVLATPPSKDPEGAEPSGY